MADHDESLIDKVKNAFGMGDDNERRDADRAATADREPKTHDDLDADRPDGWAGVPDAAGVGTSQHSVGRDEVGMHTSRSGAEGHAGQRGDTEVRPVTHEAPGGTAGTDENAAWTRGEAASGESPIVGDGETGIERERREHGL